MSALPAPTAAGLATEWTWQPLAIALALGLAGWYARAVRRYNRSARPGVRWPAGFTALFATGLVLLVWATCGFAGAYLDSLFWVWVSQQLGLLLVVPYFLMAGQPLRLTRSARVQRVVHARAIRALGNPLVAPALVPLLSVLLFFGPLPGWCIQAPGAGWVEQLVVLGVGALIVLPLVGGDGPRSSLAVGLSLAIGSFELVLDAIPGIALRLHRDLSTSYFDHRLAHGWSMLPVRDQQLGGTVLWCTAELLDVPFLVLVFRQWLKADARDAADIDAVLEAERIARGTPGPAEEGDRDAPWWLSDPAMRSRWQGRD